MICWEGVLVGFFGICEFTPRVPPRESRTLPDTWGARILGHGESNARVGSTCKWNDLPPPPMICTPYLTHIPRVLGPTPNGSLKIH